MAPHYDLCVIGTGSGNSVVDPEFHPLYREWSVAMVERDTFGGTCLNRGCIPSKMLIYPADVIEAVEHASVLGVDAHVDAVRWADIRDRTFARIDPSAAAGARWRKSLDNHTVYESDGHFVGDHELEVGSGDSAQRFTADRFVLAAGARAKVPTLPGLAEVGFHTSDTIMRVDALPQRLCVIGSGFIAVELSHVFGAYGSAVTILVRGRTLIGHEDAEMSRRLTDAFARRFDLRTETLATRVSRTGDVILVETQGPDGPGVVECDTILLATGRIPNGDQLGVERTGVSLDADGYVKTDSTLATGAPGIWALGDIRNPMQLKHLANHEARVVRHNVVSPDSPIHIDERVVPHAVFTSPQIGAAGLTEAEAVHRGHDVVVGQREYGDIAYGWAMEDTSGCAKVVVDRSDRSVLGIHVIGPQASILIQQVVQGMRFSLTVDEMAKDVIYPHPALSEVIENALLDAIARLDA